MVDNIDFALKKLAEFRKEDNAIHGELMRGNAKLSNSVSNMAFLLASLEARVDALEEKAGKK